MTEDTTTPMPMSPHLKFDSDGWLRCPKCGSWGTGTHIESVTVRDSTRKSVTVTARGEDGDGTLSVTMPGRPVTNRGSTRRMDITLHLECEGCGDGADLTFSQNKGETTLEVGKLSRSVPPGSHWWD